MYTPPEFFFLRQHIKLTCWILLFASAGFFLEPHHECIPKEGLLSSPVLSEVFSSLEPLRSSIVRKLARRGIIRGEARTKLCVEGSDFVQKANGNRQNTHKHCLITQKSL